MTDNDIERQIHELRGEVANIKTQVAEVKAEVRVTKHDGANTQQMLAGLSSRFETSQEKISTKLDSLGDKIAAINTSNARGVGFFSGMAFMVTACGGMLLFLGKILFGGHG